MRTNSLPPLTFRPPPRFDDLFEAFYSEDSSGWLEKKRAALRAAKGLTASQRDPGVWTFAQQYLAERGVKPGTLDHQAFM